MIKKLELSDPQSYINRAEPDEPTFVLLGRDSAAPATIEKWVAYRIAQGKNELGDPQVTDAMNIARAMTQYHRELIGKKLMANLEYFCTCRKDSSGLKHSQCPIHKS